MKRRCRRDAGEMQERCRRDAGGMQERCMRERREAGEKQGRYEGRDLVEVPEAPIQTVPVARISDDKALSAITRRTPGARPADRVRG